jgi:hypothetical protein
MLMLGVFHPLGDIDPLAMGLKQKIQHLSQQGNN